MRAISGYYPYHARVSTASTAQWTHWRVVGECRKCRKPRKTHDTFIPTTKFSFVKNEREKITRKIREKSSLSLGKILYFFISLARDLFLLRTGMTFQCILCRLTAKMCWRNFLAIKTLANWESLEKEFLKFGRRFKEIFENWNCENLKSEKEKSKIDWSKHCHRTVSWVAVKSDK